MNLPFSAVRAIIRKRDGGSHPPSEIESMIRGFLDGSVSDYQMTAWLMAILFRGMTRAETTGLTRAMIGSGALLPPWKDGPPVVDKHSTGGVGDKVSLALAPLAAACGLRVPMISGRALGHTGGTLDKLESIPGYQVEIDPTRFESIVDRVGCSIAGASEDLVPADRRIYALRDVSGIVESPPLIVSSILSKKAAARLDGLVLDVKVGSGGFMRSRGDARALASLLLRAGRDLGMRVEAFLTWMGDPLGETIGNALEVREAIRFLKCEPVAADFSLVTRTLACAMLRVGGEGRTAEIERRVDSALASGAALDRLRAMIAAHGGDPRVADDPDLLPSSRRILSVRSKRVGWVKRIDARAIGEIVVDLGGGRRRVEDRIDPGVGVVLGVRRGDRVGAENELAQAHVGADHSGDPLVERIREAFVISPARPRSGPPLIEQVSR